MSINLVSEDYIATYFPDRSTSEIQSIQSRANGLIADYLRTTLGPASFTDIHDYKLTVIPYHLPIVSVESIAVVNSSELLIENSNYFVYPTYIYLPNANQTVNGLRIVYTAGLEQANPMMELVAEDLIRFWAFKDGKSEELFYLKEEMEDRGYTNREISELTILSRLKSQRYKPFGSRIGGTVNIGVI
jgi:hypothetical protein